MREKLLALHKLQQVDLQALEFEKSAEQIPKKIAEYESGADAIRTELGTLNTEADALRKEQRDAEAQIDEDRQKTVKWKRRLNDIKTPREYQALSREVEQSERQIRNNEERVMELMEELENRDKGIKEKEAELKAYETEIADKVRDLRQKQAALKTDAKAARQGREEICGQLDARTLKLYERLVTKRQGIAVALTSREGVCTRCNTVIRPQMMLEIRRLDTLYQCSACSRILVLHSLLEADTDD